MERQEAIEKLSMIIGRDLRELADEYEVTVFKENGARNKGWAGHVLEQHLGLPINSSRRPNAGSWELKLISLRYMKKDLLEQIKANSPSFFENLVIDLPKWDMVAQEKMLKL